MTDGRKTIMVVTHRIFWTRSRLLLCALILCIFLLFKLSPDAYVKQRSLEEFRGYFYASNMTSPESPKFAPSSQSIFFHETADRGELDSREACAVEAAARAHPDWDIHVLFTTPAATNKGTLKTLEGSKNIHFARIHLEDYARGTPVEGLVIGGALNRTRWRISHTSDVLRYLTLYKWRGVYLDLDTVVVKSFNSLDKNWGARESVSNVAAGAISLSGDQLGRTVADMAIRDLAANFRGDDWGNNGPGVITRVLKKLCSSNNVTTMSAATCKGFEVYGPELFYPIRWQDAKEYFKPGILKLPQVIMYHVWNQVTHKMVIAKDSRYANLAKMYCPAVYKNHGEDFGVKRR